MRASENMILGFEVNSAPSPNQALDSTHKCEKATFECLGAFSGVIAPPSSKANACTTNLTLLTLKKKQVPECVFVFFYLDISNIFSCLDHTFPVHFVYLLYMQLPV